MSWLFEDRREKLLLRYVEECLDPEEERQFEQMCREDETLREEARALRQTARLLGSAPEVEAPGDLSASIMDRVSSEKPPSRVYAFFFRPRTVRVRVMTGLSVAAAVAIIVVLTVWGGRRMPSGTRGQDAGAGGPEAAVYGGSATSVPEPRPREEQEAEEPGSLMFRIAAQNARRVTLVGDFNGWSEEGTELLDEDGDGVWTLRIDASPGRYKYRFLVDDSEWVIDPEADAQVDDGFGGTDSVRYVL
jgi:hypothetical protein